MVPYLLAAEQSGSKIQQFAQEIREKLSNVDYVFTNVFGLSWLNISSAVVVSWIVMAVLILIAFILTRNMRLHQISKRQAAAEWIVVKLTDLITGMVGEHGKRYVPYLSTVLLYIGLSNIMGMFGFTPPTQSLFVTAALALMSIVLIESSGIRAHGVGGWLKSFAAPVAIVTPLNVLEIGIRPLSLCMRLFGNVLGAYIIMELIETLVPVVLPVVFSAYFDIFDGFLQAYVFVFLTSLFMKEKME